MNPLCCVGVPKRIGYCAGCGGSIYPEDSYFVLKGGKRLHNDPLCRSEYVEKLVECRISGGEED
jgi:hypothetical protein